MVPTVTGIIMVHVPAVLPLCAGMIPPLSEITCDPTVAVNVPEPADVVGPAGSVQV